MKPDKVQFACGEFIPGKKQIITPPKQPPIPPKFIPIPPKPLPNPFPKVPPQPIDDRWVCICKADSPLGSQYCIVGLRECVPLTTVAPGTRRGQTTYLSKAECEKKAFLEAPCVYPPDPVPPVTREPPSTIPPTSTRLPTTGLEPPPQPDTWWKCEVDYEYCPDGASLRRIIRRCVSRLGSDPAYPYRNQSDCETVCRDSVFQCQDVISVIPGPTTGPLLWWGCFSTNQVVEYCLDGITPKRKKRECRSSPVYGAGYNRRDRTDCEQNCEDEFFQCPNVVTNLPTGIADLGISRPPNVQFNPTLTIDLFDVGGGGGDPTESNFNGSGTYSEQFNILSIGPLNFTKFVSNSDYLDIFKNEIAQEISYLLKVVGTPIEWKEAAFTQLTIERILDSLRDDVKEIFNQVILPGGKNLGAVNAAGIIRTLLLEGRVEEFDISYYRALLEKQKTVPKVNIKYQDVSQETRERAALGYIASVAQSLDPDRFLDYEKLEVARLKALLTDVDANIPVETPVDTKSVFLEDPGLKIYSDLSAFQDISGYVGPGEGDGYYLLVEQDSNITPLILNTSVSSSYYITPYDKQIAFDILGEPLFTRFVASSIFSNSEFASGFDDNFSTSALYFKINLSSVEDIDKTSSFVDSIKVQYDLINDLEEAKNYSLTYGAMSVILNVDQNDPFIQYAKVSEQITLYTKDITFRAFTPNKGPNYSNLIRQIPFVVILQPGSGSLHNPFHGFSELTDTSDTVSRTLDVYPNLPIDEREYAIEKKLLYDVSGTYKLGYVGVADTQNLVYYFDPSQFSTEYSASSTDIHRRVYYQIIKQILERRYSFVSLTWWDVMRRLTAKEFGKFISKFTRNFFNSLSKGREGYRIRFVLSREGNTENNLILKNSSIEDIVYLDPNNRQNIRFYA